MQPARPKFKLDEFALTALAARRSSRAALAEKDRVLELELFESGDVDECAATGRFHRTSPYEHLEIEPWDDDASTRSRATTFAHTVRRPLGADGAWFDLPDAALIALEAPISEPVARWRWFAAALAAVALALPLIWLLCSALPSLLG
jgi:hypothetical protein